MEMNMYQAVFAVLLVFFVGDLVGALTKAKVSSMFVIMMGFMLLFLVGIYPADIMEISGFSAISKVGLYFLLFNMGTSVDVVMLKREWRTVACAALGLVTALAACLAVIPVVGLEFALAAAPVVNGGIVATTTMVNACETYGFETAAALATFIYATQKFVGTLPASNCGLNVAKATVAEMRKKHAEDPDYSWYTDRETSGVEKKTVLWEKLKKHYTSYICLAIAAGAILISYYLGQLCNGWVNMAIWCMVIGIICRNFGLVPPQILRDCAKANGFFSFLAMCTIIPSLAKVDWAQLPIIGLKAVIIFGIVMVFTVIVFCFSPAWKIVGSKNLAIGISMCQLIGYPGTELIANEITNAVAATPEEADALTNKLQTAYVISGFTSVTILSVVIASILAKVVALI